MNAVVSENTAPLVLGAPYAGGFYAGKINVNGAIFALIVAPKADGDHAPVVWNKSYDDVAGARSYFDGYKNTLAMADAGSELAKWALGLRIAGHDDWYLPSQDELEVLYRAVKPSAEANSMWGRSGINLSVVPPTYPYTREVPAQTVFKEFRAGGAEAFQEVAYWSSTQHAEYSGYAWSQGFVSGSQNGWNKGNKLRARAVRRLAI